MSDTSQTFSSAHLYTRLWRWHFFAALIVIPFVLWQAVTGTAYLWHREIAASMYPELLTVTPQQKRATYQQQLDVVLAHHPGQRVEGIEIAEDPQRSTIFFFRADNGLPYPAFVDPYSGLYLGAVPPTRWLTGLSRALHGGWPIKPYGSYLLELGASWAIVMILTGLYLWWPRQARGLAGVLYPRLNKGSRILWRDLHATVGVYFGLIVLTFLFTALPWTTFWGDNVLGPVQRATDQESPVGFFFAGGSDHHHATPSRDALEHEHAAHAAAAPSLDALIATARAAGARGTIELQPRFNGAPINIRDDHPRAPQEVWLQLDGHTGAVLTKVVWQDFPVLPKLISLGIDLHEGHFFGRANQIFNTLVALALIWLSITGFIGWYKRRPNGGLTTPPRHELRYPKAVLATGALLCFALPLLGASVAGIFLIDRVLGWHLAFRR